jgi:hypothetical protein
MRIDSLKPGEDFGAFMRIHGINTSLRALRHCCGFYLSELSGLARAALARSSAAWTMAFSICHVRRVAVEFW